MQLKLMNRRQPFMKASTSSSASQSVAFRREIRGVNDQRGFALQRRAQIAARREINEPVRAFAESFAPMLGRLPNNRFSSVWTTWSKWLRRFAPVE